MKCRCCGSSDIELVLDLGQQPWGNDFIPVSEDRTSERYPLEVFFCNGCSMVQLGYTVPKERMFIDHDYLSGTTKSLAKHFDEVCERILSRVSIGAGEYVLDIGGNDGTFLQGFVRRGTEVLNVESGRLQARLSDEAGVTCLNTFFNAQTAAEILDCRGPAKVIHGSGIFFHLEELHSVFDGIQVLLSHDGVVVAEFIYLPSMVKACAFDQIYHEHLLYYTIQSFEKVLEQHNLMIFDAEIVSIHGGSCIAYIGHKDSHTKKEVVHRLVQNEIEGEFDRIDTYRDFARRAADLRKSLVTMIAEVRRQGLRVQALGAPVKGSTIINYCGLGIQDIESAVEINEHKCSKWFPGTRIPVHHQYRVEPPDVYLMLSWNFRDEILSRLDAYLAGGGMVIVPIPRLEMIGGLAQQSTATAPATP